MLLKQRTIWTSWVILVMTSVSVLADDKPAQEKARDDGLYAELDTSKGKVVLALEFEKTPLTVCNFVGLAEGTKDSNKEAGKPYYDGLTFHRVIDNFMIQAGCPLGNGRGGPGYQFNDEIHPDLKHNGPGILSMANAGKGTNGSQFFITHKATPHLDGKHTVFGHVVEGQDVVNSIARNDVINKIKILRVGDKAKNFKADQAAFDKIKNKDFDMYLEKLEKDYPDQVKKTESGMNYVVTQQGQGDKPKKGDTVSVHYTGTLLDGTKFDSSVDRGQPFGFKVGTGQVIKGWDEALSDMTKGEKRILVIPADLAYGDRGIGPIPPGSTLVFDVELIDFK